MHTICNPSTREVGARGSRVQGYPWLQSEFTRAPVWNSDDKHVLSFNKETLSTTSEAQQKNLEGEVPRFRNGLERDAETILYE